MDEVRPNYYAASAGESIWYEFEVIGSHFDLIPLDAVGLIATNNDNPLSSRYREEDWATLRIAEKDDERMLINYNASRIFDNPVYLGGIVSSDRSVVYWVNNTKPLP